TLRRRGVGRDDLVIDPSFAEQASVVLPSVEPRSYPVEETVTVAFDGPRASELPAGLLEVEDDTGRLGDDAAMCRDMRVQDPDLPRGMGVPQFGLGGDELDAFVERHGDYVQISSELLPANDSYWQGAGAQCGNGGGFALCVAVFGLGDTDELPAARDLR